MSILIFVVILVVLIVGHEFGHFIAAKFARMPVIEFGVGFPPRLWGKKIGETLYSLNALPFGGFVRIYGEDDAKDEGDPTRFSNRSRLSQAIVVAAGPMANLVLAYAFIAVALMFGVPQIVDEEHTLSDARVIVTSVLPESPAERAGFKAGDVVTSVLNEGTLVPIEATEDLMEVFANASSLLTVNLTRGEEMMSVDVVPEAGIVKDDVERKAIGIASARIGTVQYSFFDAVVKAVPDTLAQVEAVFLGLISLIGGAFTLSADIENIAGPVGIAGLVGEASLYGVGSLLMLSAVISVNLAVINLLPFPALDGGRLAMLGVEAVSRRRIPASVSHAINYVGFMLLIALMVAVTVQDISRLAT